jgi:hypothetical protein
MRPPVARRRSRRFIGPLAVGVALMLLMTSCASSNNGGGGGGSADYTLYVLLVNRDSAAAHTLSYSGGAPLASSPDGETAEACTAITVRYAVVVPFEILVDDVPIIISDELENGVPADGETNMIATLDVLEDGTAVPVIGDSSQGSPVAAGTNLSKPAATGICL